MVGKTWLLVNVLAVALSPGCFSFTCNGASPDVADAGAGASWRRNASGLGPSWRTDAAMAFDAARRRVVLFGGNDGSSRLGDDTWEWDGSTWLRASPAQSPLGRASGGLAYDSARQRVVLFGGMTFIGRPFFDDTWEWDGSTWTKMAPARKPVARSGFAMTYDVARHRVVLFGGVDDHYNELADTWEWDGVTWTLKSPAAAPQGRTGHAMAYDATRQRAVLFGGEIERKKDRDVTTYFNDTWEWDGTSWTQVKPARSPLARCRHAMAYDSARHRVVLFGGYGGTYVASEGSWEWDGLTWAPIVLARASENPWRDYGQALVFDEARQRLVMFGGSVGSSSENTTWTLEHSDTR